MDDKHFDKIFFFICGLCLLVIGVDAACFFGTLSAIGQKYADNTLPILNTGAMLSGVYFLLGGNPVNKKQDTTTPVTGDNTTVVNNAPINTTGSPLPTQPYSTS